MNDYLKHVIICLGDMMKKEDYFDKLKGAIISRFAGCALGAPVEMMEIGKLKNFCKKIGNPFPPKDYFLKAPNPDEPRYKYGKGSDFTKTNMSFLSTDDDITYTILSLFIMEDFGLSFSTEDIAKYWMKYLPLECTYTAERTTLKNLLNGLNVKEAKFSDLDETEYIGAAIRIDGYGYVFPGNPKKAAELALKDANLSHQKDGIYSAMYFAALISMAFISEDIVESMDNALNYVPESSNFYNQIKWALSVKEEVINYDIANKYVTKRFVDMSWAHSINNACLTVWGIFLGRDSIEKGITETVAMAYDNDCTSATVGSVLGAYHGIKTLNKKWYAPWNDKILSYLTGYEYFSLQDIIDRYYKIGMKNL